VTCMPLQPRLRDMSTSRPNTRKGVLFAYPQALLVATEGPALRQPLAAGIMSTLLRTLRSIAPCDDRLIVPLGSPMRDGSMWCGTIDCGAQQPYLDRKRVPRSRSPDTFPMSSGTKPFIYRILRSFVALGNVPIGHSKCGPCACMIYSCETKKVYVVRGHSLFIQARTVSPLPQDASSASCQHGNSAFSVLTLTSTLTHPPLARESVFAPRL
jgi:hypothetical protein